MKDGECSNEIPNGSLPLTIDLILRGDLVKAVRAGQTCTFVGTLIDPDAARLSVWSNLTVAQKVAKTIIWELEQLVKVLTELCRRSCQALFLVWLNPTQQH